MVVQIADFVFFAKAADFLVGIENFCDYVEGGEVFELLSRAQERAFADFSTVVEIGDGCSSLKLRFVFRFRLTLFFEKR